jgi:hypothetical protein
MPPIGAATNPHRHVQTLVAHGLTVREVAAHIHVGTTALFASLSLTPSEHIEGLP